MTTLSYDEIWQRVRQLPLTAQMELAEALLHNVRESLSGEADVDAEADLQPLVGLNRLELKTLAETIVAPEREQLLKALLAKNRERTISPEETETLDALLDEVDRVALLKARALYTLQRP